MVKERNIPLSPINLTNSLFSRTCQIINQNGKFSLIITNYFSIILIFEVTVLLRAIIVFMEDFFPFGNE